MSRGNSGGYDFVRTRLTIYNRVNMSFGGKYQRAARFVQKKHRGQFRAGRVPVWHHLARVSRLLAVILSKHKEGSPKERLVVILAALGHDLIEDTSAKEEEVRSIFGNEGLAIIRSMTNRWGDKHPAPYVKQVIHSPEIVRLVKLSDLYDNITNAAFNIRLLGVRWVTSYFLPIVLPMRKALIRTRFSRYRRSAAELITLVEIAASILDDELERFKKR